MLLIIVLLRILWFVMCVLLYILDVDDRVSVFEFLDYVLVGLVILLIICLIVMLVVDVIEIVFELVVVLVVVVKLSKLVLKYGR